MEPKLRMGSGEQQLQLLQNVSNQLLHAKLKEPFCIYTPKQCYAINDPVTISKDWAILCQYCTLSSGQCPLVYLPFTSSKLLRKLI